VTELRGASLIRVSDVARTARLPYPIISSPLTRITRLIGGGAEHDRPNAIMSEVASPAADVSLVPAANLIWLAVDRESGDAVV
jgi:hypothetical protein